MWTEYTCIYYFGARDDAGLAISTSVMLLTVYQVARCLTRSIIPFFLWLGVPHPHTISVSRFSHGCMQDTYLPGRPEVVLPEEVVSQVSGMGLVLMPSVSPQAKLAA